ncbi:MAG: toll/interleukin-1 receptor domain-containing protein, partial [Defluviitaleaceae bacterium]|nr:toll/interleukin-1 receptor domain-containing protein [Defluviitaleaceae bacterium]
MNEIKRDFFVSYNKADRQWAKWIASVLEQNGYTCYIQAWDFRKGGNFVLDMQNALINSKQVIAVLSKDFLSSPYCQAEWAAAFTKDPNSEKRLFIPVRISNIKPEGLFSAISYIDLFRVNNEEEAEKLLLHGVDIKNIPRNRPSFPGTPKKRFPGSLPFNNLPFSRNHYFTGREQVFEDICSKFESGKAISLTQAIVGMGGLGKTQTALEYAYRYSDKYKWIWWVHAETELSVIASYKQFAVDMGLMNEEQHDDELIIKTVLNWMDSNDKYLFIYDNADIVSSDTSWWPRNNRANILITTRNKQNHIGEKIDIDVFTENEAVKFLQTRAKINDDLQNASLLANRLGCLPLALEQAAAYIVNNEITYGKYLSLLDNYGLELLEDVDGIKDYSLSIAATLEISIKNIDSEEARQLLYLCSYMAPEDIDEA